MKKTFYRILILAIFLIIPAISFAWEGMTMSKLHVEGRYFKDDQGHVVNLHGFAQTYSPWFNECGTKWNNYDVDACLSYNKRVIDNIMAAGWKVNFVRIHMDPYWSNTPGVQTTGENDISAFNFERFKTYLGTVFIPMVEYAISKGLYVVMRPPGVCPQKIAVGDDYNEYLLKVWDYVAQQPKLKDNPYVMYELANEPVGIYHADGTAAGFKELSDFLQPIVDVIRGHCDNIVLVPGLSYQARYEGFAEHPIEGDNVAYAVHCYPGWYNSGSEDMADVNYEKFKTGWDAQIKPVSNFAPIVVTEMDWAPTKYNSSWGKGLTGTAGGVGFGANFKKIADESGNVSYLIFTSPELLGQFRDEAPSSPDGYTFLTDPEACPWPTYHWYKDYANNEDNTNYTDDYFTVADVIADRTSYTLLLGASRSFSLTGTFADGHTADVTIEAKYSVDDASVVKVINGRMVALREGNTSVTATYTDKFGKSCMSVLPVRVSIFPLSADVFNPNIWETGSFDETTGTLVTGQYGFGGWQYTNSVDLSSYNYIIIELSAKQSCSASFRLFDENNYWSKPAIKNVGSDTRVTVDLHSLVKDGTTTPLNLTHIYIAGFWSVGGGQIKLKNVYLSNDGVHPVTSIENSVLAEAPVDVYSITGILLHSKVQKSELPHLLNKGVYIVNGKKILIK